MPWWIWATVSDVYGWGQQGGLGAAFDLEVHADRGLPRLARQGEKGVRLSLVHPLFHTKFG